MSTSYFYGVYLLCSKSTEKRYAGRCYIGFTVNPNRRINQHNRGKEFGGAKRTSNKGPWDMVMIVHGFPNKISALQFEWAWQQPAVSTRLKTYPELRRKKPKETYFQYNFRVLSRMLNVGPWYRLPLTIRWLESEYECDFVLKPPPFMQIVSGNIVIPKSQTSRQKQADDASSQPCAIWAPECHLCMQRIEEPERSRIGCINSLCKLTCHIICLANYILSMDESSKGHYIPINGECPLCESKFTWTELVHRKRKLQANGVEQIEEDDEDEEDDFDDVDEDDENNFDDVGEDGEDDIADVDNADNIVEDDVFDIDDADNVVSNDAIEFDSFDALVNGDNVYTDALNGNVHVDDNDSVDSYDIESDFSMDFAKYDSGNNSRRSVDSKSDDFCALLEDINKEEKKEQNASDNLKYDDIIYELSD